MRFLRYCYFIDLDIDGHKASYFGDGGDVYGFIVDGCDLALWVPAGKDGEGLYCYMGHVSSHDFGQLLPEHI